ncbi:MAG TPA: hypothetical protein VGD48_34185 [Kutzneria sp.]|jgi:hypothetical protein
MTEDLFVQQEKLQIEAHAVCTDLNIDALLAEFGDPVHTGSSVLGLMVRRDVDITVACPKLDTEAVARLGARLAGHERIWKVQFRNDTGRWNVEPEQYPDGLYLGLSYGSAEGHKWNFDIWFVDEPARMPDLEHVATLPPRLTAETRRAILAIKQAWADNPAYGKTVRSYTIYRSVLDDGVRTPDDFDRWLADHPNVT